MEYVVILGYFVVLLAIGAVASRRVHDLADYYVGGKKLGYWVVAFSARASGESAAVQSAIGRRSREATAGTSRADRASGAGTPRSRS